MYGWLADLKKKKDARNHTDSEYFLTGVSNARLFWKTGG